MHGNEVDETPQPSSRETKSTAFKPPDPDDDWHPHAAATKRHAKPLWNNFVTICGLFLLAVTVLLLVTFALFSAVTPTTNPYVDIIGYLVLPSILVFGLMIVPFGIFFKSWRVRRKDPTQRLAFRAPRIDLSDPSQRRVVKFFAVGTFSMLPIVGVSSYHGYHYTDSSAFCAKACHVVMEPQAMAYEQSPHARVACAECHIGEGASWFVKAKLSGTRQVLAVMRESYSRPIPPAIHNLRPARETCERCHWPGKFFGSQLREIVRFASDEANTRRELAMLLKTGGGDKLTGRTEGIHMHMALKGRIEYVATDERLQHIPWVRYVDDAGHELVYRSDGKPSSDPRPNAELRQLDCMDCHNRPAHRFNSPQESVDILLDVGRIDASLPYIKREAVAALVQSYADVPSAERQIGERLESFYTTNYPEVWITHRTSINSAVDRIREVYTRNFFPYMRVDWKTYPDNIGHLTSRGCFRCHDGSHVNQRGERISHDCGTCHTFLLRKTSARHMIEEGAFVHPVALVGNHAELRCDQCHTGGVAPEPSCAGCHTAVNDFRGGSLASFDELDLPADPMQTAVDCESCHDLTQPLALASIDELCIECHDEEERFEGMLAAWKGEVDTFVREAESKTDADGRDWLEALRAAGPLHNIEATRILIRSLKNESDALTVPE